MKGEHGNSGAWGSGVYENEYALVDGRWKISKLHYYLTFRANYEGGWSKSPLPIEKVSATVAAGRSAHGSVRITAGGLPAAVPLRESRLEVRARAPTLGTPPDDLTVLANRISLLNDEIEVQNVQRAYGYYVDKSSGTRLPSSSPRTARSRSVAVVSSWARSA